MPKAIVKERVVGHTVGELLAPTKTQQDRAKAKKLRFAKAPPINESASGVDPSLHKPRFMQSELAEHLGLPRRTK